MAFITADPRKDFIAKKFKQYPANIGIIIENTLVEAHPSISLVKHYHESLQQVYTIVISKIPEIKFDIALQIFLKAIDNLFTPNKLVAILLVFGQYPRITKFDVLSSIICQPTIAIIIVLNKI